MKRCFGTLNVFAIILALCVVWCGSVRSVQAQCDWEEVQKLLASDGSEDDQFSKSVSIDGEVMVIGAYKDDNDYGTDAGSVYVFRYDGAMWVEEAILLASDGEAYDWFGISTSIDGDVIVIGADHDDDNGSNSGSAYVFRYDGSMWIEEAKLLASDGVSHDRFGVSVSIGGDTIAIGAYLDDDNDINSGSAYVFQYDKSTWVEKIKLIASDGRAFDQFGITIAIDGDVILVGACTDAYYGDWYSSAYVFRHDGYQWIEEAILCSSDSYDDFGISLSIDDHAIVVGAFHAEDNGYQSGAAYVFRYDGSDWVEETKLLASDGSISDLFGYSVSIDGDVIVVGAFGDDEIGCWSPTGSAYVFRYYGSTWVEEVKLLASDRVSDDRFGETVSVDGNVIVVGAYGDDDSGEWSGSAYVFNLTQCPTLSISPDPLIAGEYGLFEGTNLNPNEDAYLAYSLEGYGSANVPQLNITLDLAQAIRVKTMRTADSSGYAFVNLSIPPHASGLDIWFQACQYELKTNVVATSIE